MLRTYDRCGNIWFWFDRQSPHVSIYDEVACTHLWGYRLVSQEFPSLIPEDIHAIMLRPGIKVVILDQQDDAVDRARASLGQKGVGTDVVYQDWIGEQPAGLRLTLLQTHPLVQQPH